VTYGNSRCDHDWQWSGWHSLAADFAKEGRNVVLFERDALGGSCVNYSCTPSKAFLAAAHAADRARKADKLGIHAQAEVTSISKNGHKCG